MFIFRQFFHKSVALPEREAVSDQKLPLVENSEKASLFSGYVQFPPPKRYTKHQKLCFIGKFLLLSISFFVAFVLFSGSSIRNYATLHYKGFHCNHSDESHDTSSKKLAFVAAPPWAGSEVGAVLLDRKSWVTTCSSETKGFECKLAFDDTNKTFWRSQDKAPGVDHSVVIDLQNTFNVHTLELTPPREASLTGFPQNHRVEIATKPNEWKLVGLGAWRKETDTKYSIFEPQLARYVRLTILDTTQGPNTPTTYAVAADIQIYQVKSAPVLVKHAGRWNVTLNFPIVPVTAFLNPKTQNLIVMSSTGQNFFTGSDGRKETWTSTWDVKTSNVTSKLVKEANHNMFCPGTSYDEKGRVIITGGSTPDAITIYDPDKDLFITPVNSSKLPAKLKIDRGYQGQTYMPNGKVFTVGGSWLRNDLDKTDRDGEVYDTNTHDTKALANVLAAPFKMLPSIDCPNGECNTVIVWQQHHAWLFAWKEDSVFHAGPSSKMNWVFTETPGGGAVLPAGIRRDNSSHYYPRPPPNDTEALCGITSMYDAEAGIILAAGGAPNYHYWYAAKSETDRRFRKPAHNLTYEIKLGSVGSPVKVTAKSPMHFPRIFASSVILPTGETFVVGGQVKGEPFWDDTWVQTPEIYDPEHHHWRKVANHSTPRVYHSWAILLPNATVIVGGSGLDPDLPTNHYDAQIYEPAYLFHDDAATIYAKRPKILQVDKKVYKVGDTITITTDSDVHAGSLIRYSATTHTVNNDLRRIKLHLTTAHGNHTHKKFTAKIPADPGVTLPGFWMLFVLEHKVPSVAETVQILK